MYTNTYRAVKCADSGRQLCDIGNLFAANERVEDALIFEYTREVGGVVFVRDTIL